MTYYVIQHIATGKFMPQAKRGKGYTHWNPETGRVMTESLDVPRLFTSSNKARNAIIAWYSRPNAHFNFLGDGYYDEPSLVYSSDGRKKEDLQVVKVSIKIQGVEKS